MVVVISRGELQDARSRQDHLDRIKEQQGRKAKRKRVPMRAIKQVHRDFANRDLNSRAERDSSAPAPTAA